MRVHKEGFFFFFEGYSTAVVPFTEDEVSASPNEYRAKTGKRKYYGLLRR